jgi:hypothetical protein
MRKRTFDDAEVSGRLGSQPGSEEATLAQMRVAAQLLCDAGLSLPPDTLRRLTERYVGVTTMVSGLSDAVTHDVPFGAIYRIDSVGSGR